ncbi:asparagine synthase (glutamine-hydrolyzing) [Dyella flagellata]|uniref:asparagine synthase (glutamine-hydrolyzing) n=1 Tax=Dyella flagellata TaxID=1867833 RepID=A0ABQ5X8D8_9GAMM|nr:asparagine synthase (glutamine-hydrolyzing) [Dyella flagellata]GLQ87911.1 asparagine synthetase B [Dyella flagellata]
MCGIGAIYAHGAGVDPQMLQRMRRTLAHRGPDGEGEWLAPDGNVGLLHTRLSIVGLANGEQPMRNEDGRLCVTVNGEFYDFEHLRAKLMQRGHRFRSESDSEVALHLYEEHGDDCVRMLRGEFAFCLWDGRARRLLAVRDRFGIKPLFYAQWNGLLLFASEIKALFAAGVPAVWDRQSTLDQLFICLPEDRTPYAGIRQLPPGHRMIVDAKGMRIEKYWDMDYPLHDQDDADGERAQVEQLRTALDEAVRLRLRADVPVGCFLSGGLDSSSVLGIASRHAATPMHAFTVCFEESYYNERDYAQSMAAFAGATFVPTEVRHADLSASFREALWHGEMFALNGHGVARYIHSKAIHEAGWKVVLSGSGSDDLLGGYPSARQDMLQNALLRGTAGASFAAEQPLLHQVQQRLGFVPSWMSKLAADRSILFVLMHPDMVSLYERRNPFEDFLDSVDARQLAGRDAVIQSLYLWTKAFLGNYELLAERLEMAHGLEVRLPFLDHHLFEVIKRIPAARLIKGQQEKYALRQAARPYLPDLICKRSKHSFTAPPITLDAESPFYELLQDSLRSERFKDVPFFDAQTVVELLDRLPSMGEDVKLSLDGVMTMTLSAALLQEMYSVGSG